MSVFLAAALQMRSTAEPSRNADDLERLVRDAAAAGASYIQSPEMTGALVREPSRLRSLVSSADDDLIVQRASALARELRVVLHIGSTAVLREDGKVANRAFVFGHDGSTLASYDKIHMFDATLPSGERWCESETYEPGAVAHVVKLPQADIGLAICYDLRFPHMFRAQAMAGAQILTVPSAFTRPTGEAHWHILVRARAIENGAFVVAAAQGGVHQDGSETFGHSLIVGPWGEVLAHADHDRPCVLLAELDMAKVERARSTISSLAHTRSFALGDP